ncbi:MAG: cupin domain-containing protein [Woeseiaceae bacterium]|nr:cupin domain-containing protein [Woeseiaceae bacterium]
MADPLLPAAARDEVLTRERCFITELLNDPAAPQVSLARCRVPPGVTTERHRLTVDEWYVVAAGTGSMQVGDTTPFDVGPGDAVAIPAGTSQCITNTGPHDLVFQCLCTPRFTPAAYVPLPDDRRPRTWVTDNNTTAASGCSRLREIQPLRSHPAVHAGYTAVTVPGRQTDAWQ